MYALLTRIVNVQIFGTCVTFITATYTTNDPLWAQMIVLSFKISAIAFYFHLLIMLSTRYLMIYHTERMDDIDEEAFLTGLRLAVVLVSLGACVIEEMYFKKLVDSEIFDIITEHQFVPKTTKGRRAPIINPIIVLLSILVALVSQVKQAHFLI